jgi:multidrug efflux pump subunit AcrA (membrane-fusion protein)
MSRVRFSISLCGIALIGLGLAFFSRPATTRADEGGSTIAGAESSFRLLADEVRRLSKEVSELREELAESRLEADRARDELAELRQFIADHGEFGRDFDEYQAIKAIREREAKLRAADEAQRQRAAARAERRRAYDEARARRTAEEAEQERLDSYEDAGFSPIGLDVFGSRMSFVYRSNTRQTYRIDYEPGFGRYIRLGGIVPDTDFSQMTISGSVLNAAEETRDLGVAITFFDENGNQVGAEIVRINNARPNVPYPFTSTLEMALNRPFTSSSIYVLYADPVE